MKKIKVLSFIIALVSSVFIYANDFVKIKGVKISGNEDWTVGSEFFIDDRKLTIPGYYICDHEVTRGEWKSVLGSYPGYSSKKINYSEFDKLHRIYRGRNEVVTADFYDKNGKKLDANNADNNPATLVNFYDIMFYCNERSVKEGLTPCYTMYVNIGEGLESTKDTKLWYKYLTRIDWVHYSLTFTCDFNANGYRLPTSVEWEWAARGNEKYNFAGSDNFDEVAWTKDNSKGTRDVKTKKPNGFGLYDMNGNVSEIIWEPGENPITDKDPSTLENHEAPGDIIHHRALGGSFDEYAKTSFVNFSAAILNNGPEIYAGFRVVRTDTNCKEYQDADPNAIAIKYENKFGYVKDKKKVKKGYVLKKEDLPVLSKKDWQFMGWGKSAGEKINKKTWIHFLLE